MNTKPQAVECVWLDEAQSITLSELAQVCGLSTTEVEELVEYGAISPLPGRSTEVDQHLFSADCVSRMRAASRLRMDFELDLFAVALLLDHIQRIETLEQQVRSLQAQLPMRH